MDLLCRACSTGRAACMMPTDAASPCTTCITSTRLVTTGQRAKRPVNPRSPVHCVAGVCHRCSCPFCDGVLTHRQLLENVPGHASMPALRDQLQAEPGMTVHAKHLIAFGT